MFVYFSEKVLYSLTQLKPQNKNTNQFKKVNKIKKTPPTQKKGGEIISSSCLYPYRNFNLTALKNFTIDLFKTKDDVHLNETGARTKVLVCKITKFEQEPMGHPLT